MAKYLTMQEVADELGMSVSGIYKVMDRDPQFKTFKVGGRRLMSRNTLEEYIQQAEQRDREERGLA